MGENLIIDLLDLGMRQTLAVQAFLAAKTEMDIVRLVTDFPEISFDVLTEEVVLKKVSPRESARLLALALKAIARR